MVLYLLALLLIQFPYQIEVFEEPESFELRRVAEIENPTWRRFYHHTRNAFLNLKFMQTSNWGRLTANCSSQLAVSREEFGAKQRSLIL